MPQRCTCAGLLACIAIASGIQLNGADGSGPALVTVCQILSSPQDYDHKTVFLLGRVTKLMSGRWIGEDSCGSAIPTDNAPPPRIAIRFDRESGPRPPEPFELDSAEAKRRFSEVGQRTVIHEFRFGSGEYERWGIAFGKIEMDKGTGSIVCRSDAMVLPWGGQVR